MAKKEDTSISRKSKEALMKAIRDAKEQRRLLNQLHSAVRELRLARSKAVHEKVLKETGSYEQAFLAQMKQFRGELPAGQTPSEVLQIEALLNKALQKDINSSKELRARINSAMLAIEQWRAAANIPESSEGVMIDAQIDWLKELLGMSHIELKR